MKTIKKSLPLYTHEPYKDGVGYSIAELYCNEDGSNWGYATKEKTFFETEEQADNEVKRLMDEAGDYAYQLVDWIVE